MGNLNFAQIITFVMMGIALGMDAFSLGIGIGTQRLSWKQIARISITIGVFHVFMPLIGIVIGYYFTNFIGNIATSTGGIILIIIGANMIWSSIIGEEKQIISYSSIIGVLLLAFSVSIDALSVGFTLGLFSVSVLWFVVLLFGFAGFVMSALGLSLGRKIGDWAGDYGEVFGGIILLVFGIKFLV
ncbi:hypothetical protein BHF71_01335 [Vulcanibacillus modesticaldus]|uniref:Putative manganese efflux pump MntP n=1 Tax=Vulcanibacillus modesticaldus TaxID=337097 RepID=A0A1D2YW34_9BACI|nr:manganese efflux pump MntP family protein [Vulcanibacillus modesticaldus]OEF99846.1 hypothetical protein BHF71_01335 [Vulcanibacillus modesticaldus]